MVPTLIQMPNVIGSYMNNMDNFTIDTNIHTTSPIEIPKNNPLLIINYNNQTPADTAKVILNNNVLYYGFALQQNTINLSEYKNVLSKKTEISNVISFMLILMIPMLLLILYFGIAAWFLLIAIIATLLSFIIAPIMKYRVKFKHMFNTAMYGISLTVFLNMIFLALGFWFYYIQYLPLLIFMIAGIVQTGEKEDKKMKGKYVEVKG